MSLNDPRWGRNTSDDNDSDQQKTPQVDETKQNEPEPREPEMKEPRQEYSRRETKREEMDIEELWKQFNDRLNSMLGNKSRSRHSMYQQKEEEKYDSKYEDGGDYQEPPLRNPEQFKNTSGGNFNGGGKPPIDLNNMTSKASGSMGLLAILIAVGAWLASGFYIVPEGQRGVVTTFGKYSETTQAGFRWHVPYPVQDVDLVDVSSVRKAEIGIRGSSQRLREALMLTDDENIVDVMFNVQYRIKDGPGAEEFLFRTRDPLGAVIQTAESAMREVVGRKKMDSVLFESKLEIAQEVQKLMQEMLDRYHSGIQVLSVAIQNAQPPEQVQAAFNDAVKAGQDRERQINEGEAYANDVVPKARGLAERLRQEAEGYKAGVISQAEGEASRFNQVYEQYKLAPKVTRDRMYVDTVKNIFENTSKVMIDNKQSNSLLYLPMDKLIEKSKESGSNQSIKPLSVQPVQETAKTTTPTHTSRDAVRSLSRDLR